MGLTEKPFIPIHDAGEGDRGRGASCLAGSSPPESRIFIRKREKRLDFRIIQCSHWRPRRKANYGAYCWKCNSVILLSLNSVQNLVKTINHEVFHAIFCRWGYCDACDWLDKPNLLTLYSSSRLKRNKRKRNE
jgi:hypothetical protein